MTPDASATLVWIAPDPPDAKQVGALASWGRVRGVTLVPPGAGRPPTLPASEALADEAEELLARAREAIVEREGEVADHALDAAESHLRAHPELPQAAWLMAELERARSMRWRRSSPPDPEAAERAWLRAEALDGGRVAGVGEVGAAGHLLAASVSLAVPPGDEAWLDGHAAKDPVVSTSAGLHALVVTLEGAPVWATWLDLPAGASSVETGAPGVEPCSAEDTHRAVVRPAGAPPEVAAIEAASVRCPRWMAATAGSEPGTIRVAVCEASRCGPLLDWRTTPPAAFVMPPVAVGDGSRDAGRARGWPAWATWVVAGAGTAIAASVVVAAAAGALRATPTETIFVSGGLKTQ